MSARLSDSVAPLVKTISDLWVKEGDAVVKGQKLVGIDRFMSECRSLTNFIGNGVATIAISRWEKEVTPETLRANLRNPPPIETEIRTVSAG